MTRQIISHHHHVNYYNNNNTLSFKTTTLLFFFFLFQCCYCAIIAATATTATAGEASKWNIQNLLSSSKNKNLHQSFLPQEHRPITPYSFNNTRPMIPLVQSMTRNFRVTVSGVSSGAMFATQLHVAYSSMIKGAAIIAGAPYYCAQANVAIALTSCMTDPSLIIVPELVAITRTTAMFGYIDDPSKYMKDSKVILVSGTRDSVVDTGVVKKAADYYSHYISSSSNNIVQVYNVPAEHSWISPRAVNPCGYLGEPYMNNCDGLDVPGKVLEHVLDQGALKPRVNNANLDRLFSYDQKQFVPFSLFTMEELGLNDFGYIYVPLNCQSAVYGNNTHCPLHVSLHGCLQDVAQIGDTFAVESGLNEWAEANDIIVLYPQARVNTLNPKGCWDWWGYEGVNYASNTGYQMKTVKNTIDAIVSGGKSFTKN